MHETRDARPPRHTAADTTHAAELEELRRSLRERDDFIAMLAHELRNPLDALVNAGRILEWSGPQSGDAGRACAVVARQVHQLSRIVGDLLDYERAARGQLMVRTSATRAAEVLGIAVEQVHALREEKQQELVLEVDDDALVEADRARAVQIVVNLLTNAIRYSDPAGTITVGAARDGDFVRLHVADDGIGIARDRLASVFALGARSGASEDGLGLGLALVKLLTELHGGRVQAMSDGPGTGARFEVFLPAAAKIDAASGCAGE